MRLALASMSGHLTRPFFCFASDGLASSLSKASRNLSRSRAGKSTEGQLTETERAEYAGYVRANKFIAILQRQARQLIGI